MNRLYVVEPLLTTTGAHADHRLRVPASQIEAYVISLAAELAHEGVSLGELDAVLAARGPSTFPFKWMAAVARDLARNRGQCAIVVGSGQPPIVHALVHLLNHALGNVGTTVDHAPPTDPLERDGVTDLRALADALSAGSVDTLVILGGNPVYDAPADLGFAERLSHASFSVHLSAIAAETSAKCTWHWPRAHELEVWGDQRSLDGTYGIQQPLLTPIFDARSELEAMALLAGMPDDKSYELVRLTMRETLLASHGLVSCGPDDGGKVPCKDASGKATAFSLFALEHEWKKTLRDGLQLRAERPAPKLEPQRAEVAKVLAARAAVPAPSRARLEVVFVPDAKMLDGRHANNSWLQELPDPITKIGWDNAALISPATARALGVESGDVVRLSRGERSISIALHVQPGTADDTIGLALGWGRTVTGKVGTLRGFDVMPLRTSDAPTFAAGVRLTRTDVKHELVRGQRHDDQAERPLAREATLAEYIEKPHFAELRAPPRRSLPLWSSPDYGKGHQWGMTIDLNACTGCNACVVACQAENNVPVVGKEQLARGREMYWLRIDRYFVEEGHGATPDEPLVAMQPLACMQCEAAPCENVCPVAATMHSPEGLSEIAYNRCLGTRYCANNCPYKVRRFNYLTFQKDGVWREVGRLPETLSLQHNPNVTVRSRGIVEKCSYCVQRIQARRFDARREGREIRDGDIQTACQQTCPSNAIVFGDLNDAGSAVTKLAMSDRRYGLLEELGTKPRTTYLAKVRNPNPEMA